MGRVLRELPDGDLDYSVHTGGPPSLREVLAAYLARTRGIPPDADALFISRGYVDGLDLICRVLKRRGVTRVAMESPCIPQQGAIAELHGLHPVGVPLDERGLLVDRLAAAKAGAVIVTPAHQFPLGVVLSPERRRALAAWAERTDTLIIENDFDAEFRYDGPPIPAVRGLAPDRTICLGTASKSLAPAVHLGWIASPAPVSEALADLTVAGAGSYVGLNGHVFERMLRSGAYERHVQRCRREYRRRRRALVSALDDDLPSCEVVGSSGGLHLTLRLPPRTDVAGVVPRLRDDGVLVRSMSYYGAPHEEPAIVLGYGRLATESVPWLVRSLKRAISEAQA